MIIELISKYLLTNKRLVVPKLGAFIVKEATQSILFSNLIKSDDGTLRGLLVAEGVSEIEAAAAIDRFVFEVNYRLENDKMCKLKGFGVLTTGVNGTLGFKYDASVDGDNLDGNIEPRATQTAPAAAPVAESAPVAEPEEEVHIEVVPRKPKAEVERKPASESAARPRQSGMERRSRPQNEYVKGLRYGKGRKVVTGREGATSRKSSKGDLIIKIAIAAAVMATLALAYGLWNEWRYSSYDEPAIINSDIYEQEPASAEKEVRNPDLDYITPKEN